MTITPLKTKNTRRQPGNADPARAFGSEEQLMAEFQRQEYIQPPRQAVPSVLSGIRERLANLTARPHETDAPVYSADTYAAESAPDLGWEAAFDPEAAPPAPQENTGPVMSAAERFEQFRHTVYSSPDRYRPAPIYEEISFQNPTPRETTYQKPIYEEITFSSPAPRASAPIEPPIYEDLTPGARPYEPVSFPEEADPGFGANDMPFSDHNAPEPYDPAPAPAAPVRRGSDFQYAFWSGSILAGVALTLFSFIYACVM